MRSILTKLIVGVPLCLVVPNVASGAEATAARAQTMLKSGKLEAAAELYLQAFRETKVEAHARQAGLIYLKLGPERSADARYALTLYLRAAKTPEQQREANDLLLIAGEPSAAPKDGSTTVTTETKVDGSGGTLTHSETTGSSESTTTLDGRERTLTHTETGADGTSTTEIDGANAAVSHSSVSADGRERVDASASPEGGSYEKQVDCSKDPKNHVCEERTKLGVGEGGLSASYKKTEVKKVAGLHKNPLEARVGASYMSASASEGDSSTSLYGVSGTAQWALGKLPGASGGSFFGVSGGVNVAAGYGSLSGGIDGHMTQIQVLFPVGLQWYSFGSQDPVSLKQSGFGAFVGYSAGFSDSTTTFDIDGEEISNESKGFAHGPRLNVTFPSFNWGTAAMSGFGVSGMILPLEAATVYMVSAEWVMGEASAVN